MPPKAPAKPPLAIQEVAGDPNAPPDLSAVLKELASGDGASQQAALQALWGIREYAGAKVLPSGQQHASLTPQRPSSAKAHPLS